MLLSKGQKSKIDRLNNLVIVAGKFLISYINAEDRTCVPKRENRSLDTTKEARIAKKCKQVEHRQDWRLRKYPLMLLEFFNKVCEVDLSNLNGVFLKTTFSAYMHENSHTL